MHKLGKNGTPNHPVQLLQQAKIHRGRWYGISSLINSLSRIKIYSLKHGYSPHKKNWVEFQSRIQHTSSLATPGPDGCLEWCSPITRAWPAWPRVRFGGRAFRTHPPVRAGAGAGRGAASQGRQAPLTLTLARIAGFISCDHFCTATPSPLWPYCMSWQSRVRARPAGSPWRIVPEGVGRGCTLATPHALACGVGFSLVR